MEEKKKTAREIIEGYDGPAVRIMEVCGTHTHEIFRLGIRKLLPKQVELISGPGCPVCVTPVSYIDEAVYLGREVRRVWQMQEAKAGRSISSIHLPMRKNMQKNIRKKRLYSYL